MEPHAEQVGAARPHQRRGLIFERLADGSGVVVDQDGASYALNPTGAAVWALCDGRHDAPAMAAALAQRYQTTARSALPAVVSLLEQLHDLELLEVPELQGIADE